MPRILRFEIPGKDCIVDLRPDNTIFDLMAIICAEWLDDVRGGDGGVTSHMWQLVSPTSVLHVGPFADMPRMDQCGDYNGEISESITKSTALSELAYLNSPGSKFKVEYDFGSTTSFRVVLKSIEDVTEEHANACPKLFLPATGEQPEYVPPQGTPNLNDMFPHANTFLFGEASIAKWILLFPMNMHCATTVEAGPSAMGDMVFCPNKFSSAQELLVALDLAGQKQPPRTTRPDAFSRMVFPAVLNSADEKKYKSFKEDLDAFHARCAAKGLNGDTAATLDTLGQTGMSDGDLHRLCGPAECSVRVTKDALDKSRAEFDFSKAFPKSSKAHDDKAYVWISYRRGKMQICKGKEVERGIPESKGVVAESRRKIHSLHEFFCVAESLFLSVK